MTSIDTRARDTTAPDGPEGWEWFAGVMVPPPEECRLKSVK
jgi:hypothetical protein